MPPCFDTPKAPFDISERKALFKLRARLCKTCDGNDQCNAVYRYGTHPMLSMRSRQLSHSM